MLLLTVSSGDSSGEPLDMQASLVPDLAWAESWNEVVVEMDDTIPEGNISLKSSSSLMALFLGTSCSDDHGHRPSPSVSRPTRMKMQTQTQMRTSRTRARAFHASPIPRAEKAQLASSPACLSRVPAQRDCLSYNVARPSSCLREAIFLPTNCISSGSNTRCFSLSHGR